MVQKIEELTFITGNSNKFKEINSWFKENGLNIKLNRAEIPMIEPQWDSLQDVAKFKLESISNKIQGNIFIEDAGFFVESLQGFPGVYSAYVNKTIGNPGILNLMHDIKNRRAKFVCVVAARLKNSKTNDEILLFTGEVLGNVALEMRGSNGFGFDPIFIPDENPKYTFAELNTEEKNKISHRSRAIQKFIQFLI